MNIPTDQARRMMYTVENVMTGKFQILSEFYQFMKERKKWWLGPIVLMLLLLGLLIILTEGSAVAPFVYALF